MTMAGSFRVAKQSDIERTLIKIVFIEVGLLSAMTIDYLFSKNSCEKCDPKQ